jgi:hypothetical protein
MHPVPKITRSVAIRYPFAAKTHTNATTGVKRGCRRKLPGRPILCTNVSPHSICRAFALRGDAGYLSHIDPTHPIARFARLCRTVAVGLVAHRWPGRDQASLEAQLAARPVVVQALWVGAGLGVLLIAAFAAAQFGWVGLLVYLVGVIALVG